MIESTSTSSFKRSRNFSFSYNHNKIGGQQTSYHTTETKKSKLQSSSSQSELAKQIEEQILYLPKLHPQNICIQEPKKTVIIKNNKYNKPYTRLKYFETLAEEISNPNKEYEGQFIDGYMSSYERYKLDEAEKNKKILAGMFKGYSGVASEMPVRKEGTVRISGPYVKPEEVTYNREKPNLLSGPWRPAPQQELFSPIKHSRKVLVCDLTNSDRINKVQSAIKLDFSD